MSKRTSKNFKWQVSIWCVHCGSHLYSGLDLTDLVRLSGYRRTLSSWHLASHRHSSKVFRFKVRYLIRKTFYPKAYSRNKGHLVPANKATVEKKNKSLRRAIKDNFSENSIHLIIVE